MRFFTPQLYQQFNSPDDETADRANEAWEGAIDAYRTHLESIRGGVPSGVAKLAELDLHDAEVLSRVEEIQAGAPYYLHEYPYPVPISPWTAVAIVTVRQEGAILSLIYGLWDRLRTHAAPEGWAFSKEKEHWLYDEVDIASEPRGPFVHRILLSTGVELEVPFTTVVIHRVALAAERPAEARPRVRRKPA